MNIQTHHTRRSHIAHTLIGSLYLPSLLAITPVVVIAGPAGANEAETASATVSLTDLDLTTSVGMDAAHKRLVAAAQRLCRKFSDSLRTSDRRTTAACYRETLADATHRFNALLAAASAESMARNKP